MMRPRTIASVLAAGALALSSAVAGANPAMAAPTPTPDTPAAIAPISAAMPLSSDVKIKAWQDLRFGLFIHWGVYSMYGGYYKGNKQWLGYPEQIKAWGGTRDDFNAGGIPDTDYIAMAQTMTIPDFNAAQWCQSAKDAGMKYLLVTSKHHDGFAMWDTKTTDYKFPHYSPTKRDPLKELADACNSKGVKLAFYFSIIDWSKQKAEPYQNRNKLDNEMMELIHAQLQELLSGNYGSVPELWFDMGDPTPEQSAQMARWVHDISPNTMVNSRVWNEKGDFEVGGDNHLVSQMTLGPWESIRSTFPACWGYCTWPQIQAVRQSENGVATQTREEVVNLFTTIANGGQYLLNIGPKGTGGFDPFETRILDGISQWQTRHPHAIHGAVPTYYPTEKWGYSVINGNAIYLGVTNWTNGGQIRLRGAGSNVTAVSIDDATQAEQTLTYRVEETTQDLIITLPEQAPESTLPVIKVSTNGEPTYVPATAATVEKGTVSTVEQQNMTTIASPLNGQGTARTIAYVTNPGNEPAQLLVGGEASLDPSTPLDVTINGVTVSTTLAQLADGIEGFTLAPKSTARVTVERANKTYYAEGLGGWRSNLTNMWFGVADPDAAGVVVHHEYVSADDTPLPAELKAKEPADRTVRAISPKVRPSAPEQGNVVIGENNWTFIGWDAEEKSAVGTNRLVFTGKWKAGPLRYFVTYSFVNGSPDHQMPRGIEHFIPPRSEHDKGSTVTAAQVRPEIFRDYSGKKTWRFMGWQKDTIENISGPGEFIGTWEYQRDQDITITHAFIGKDGAQLPQAVLDVLPPSVTKEAPVSRVTPSTPTATTVQVEGGSWVFDGYDKTLVRWPAGPSEHFTGTWHFEKTRHPVTFTFVSADPQRAIPEDLAGAVPEALEVIEGEGTTLPQPYLSAFAEENADGVWTFQGWSLPRLDAVNEPTEITGTWAFTPGEVGTATYVLAPAVDGLVLPDVLSHFMPQPEPYIVGGTAKPARLHDKYAFLDDTVWKFVGWEPEQIDNAGAQVTFTAKWATAPSEVTVSYAFDAAGSEIPAEVNALLPGATQHAFGDEHRAPQLETTQVETIAGTWNFAGWNTAVVTLEEDITITGEWVFTPRQFSVSIELDNLPDVVAAMHDLNATVVLRDNMACAPAPLKETVETDSDIWTFSGWEKECYTLDEVLKLANVQGIGGNAGGMALFATAENSGVVYVLTFVPTWEKSDKPDSAEGTNGVTDSSGAGNPAQPNGTEKGKGQPSTSASDDVTAQGGSAADPQAHLSSVGQPAMNVSSHSLAHTGVNAAPALTALGFACAALILVAVARRRRGQ